MGLVLGTLFAIFQRLELKRHTSKTSRWILANALGWALGIAIIFLGASIPSVNSVPAVTILIATISGLLVGLSVGAITGLFLIRLEFT